MTTEKQIRERIDKEFKEEWNKFVEFMNSGKKPLILKIFKSTYPTNDIDKLIAERFFIYGCVKGSNFVVESVRDKK